MGRDGINTDVLHPDSFEYSVDTLTTKDTRLAAIVRRYGRPPFWRREPGFATLIKIVLEQQVSLNSAHAVFERLQRIVRPFTPANLAALSPGDLGQVGLTRQKQSYCHHIATMLTEDSCYLERLAALPDHEANEMLAQIKGIGPWTANIYLLIALCRRDIWPVGDIALVRAVHEFVTEDRGVDVSAHERLADAWRPWRGTAVRILWHGYLAQRNRVIVP